MENEWPVVTLETGRLVLSELSPDTDTEFICRLLNEPSFLEMIGDRGVRDETQAVSYIESGPVHSYRNHGFGLYKVVLSDSGAAIGISGLVKRDTLEHPDVGFALFPEFWGQGYATESARAAVDQARTRPDIPELLGITDPINAGSIRVLEKLGFAFVRQIRMDGENKDINLYHLTL